MKKIIMSMLLVLVTVPTFALVPLKGFVESVSTGELEPQVNGDAYSCILMVRTSAEKRVGLVNRDYLKCAPELDVLESLKWNWVSVKPEMTKEIKDTDRNLKILRDSLGKDTQYLWWNGEFDGLLFRAQEIKRLQSNDLKPLAKLGRQLVKKEIGGNAGALELRRVDEWPGQLTSEDILRKLLYSKGAGEFLEEVTISQVETNPDELESAVENLVSEDYATHNGQTEFRNSLLRTLDRLARSDDFDFFTGSLGGRDNYSTSFVAVHDVSNGEWVILIQGYRE